MLATSQVYHFCKSGGRTSKSRLSRWQSMANLIVRRSEVFLELSTNDLLKKSRDLQWSAKTGTPLHALLIDAYALARAASQRALEMMHYPVQLVGGIALFEGNITEMQTGEGKTLTAVLPTYLRALTGESVHVVTVNDYLAKRDMETMGRVYSMLGLSIGCIQTEMETDERREAYAKDITYGTSKEMGFDFLRDRLRRGAGVSHEVLTRHYQHKADDGGEAPVQRGYHFALIDEADSILVDEARTPLIIGLTIPNDASTVSLLRWSQRASHHLERDKDYIYEPDRRSAYLTDAGCRRVLLMGKPSLLDTTDSEKMYKSVEQGLTSRLAFELDRDYVVHEDKIVIVDESTGRMMDGRKWQDGLHQAVEAKERIPITAGTGQAARVTVQSFYREYQHLAGMTGTAALASRELKRSYELKVTVIPTNRPCIRAGLPARIFDSMQKKWEAVVVEIQSLVKQERAVLVETPSVEASEALGKALQAVNIKQRILNAKFHDMEADIVSDAGQPGCVTIATNMAGRGTDINLLDKVRENGGLHVIATEMHSSARIDRQLVGRAARQGDPGSYQFFLSLEDELLRCLEPKSRAKMVKQASPNSDGEISRSWLSMFQKTQRFLERTHRKQRKELLKQEKNRLDSYRKMGLDPFLELTE